jgi:DNA (cytosine-5-)-methyltransferase
MENFRDQVIIGDCIDIMRALPESTFAACLTDPPYNYEFIGRQWDHEEIQRRKSRVAGKSSTLVKNIPYGSGLAGGVRNKRWYAKNRQNIVDYRTWCTEWAAELFRILKPGAFALIFNSTRTIAHVQVALEDVGFYARDILVWRRHAGIPKGLNFSKKLEKLGNVNASSWIGWHSALRNEWEAIVVVQKPLINNYLTTIDQFGVGLFHAEDMNGFRSNIIEGFTKEASDRFDDHATVKPLRLMEYLVDLIVPPSDENIVIDPFLGSGTTAVACKNLGVPYFGIEIESEYLPLIRRRLEDSEKPDRIL